MPSSLAKIYDYPLPLSPKTRTTFEFASAKNALDLSWEVKRLDVFIYV